MNNRGEGKIVASLVMRHMEKLYFDTYSDAEMWLENTTVKNDGLIREENSRYYIFVDPESQKLQSI